MLKRILDIFFGLIGVLIALPVFPIIGLLIKLDSKGPVFYGCNRVGKDEKSFRMWKFRTMVELPVAVGASLSPQGDVRVTRVGRFLRRAKLNELPQLINILKGEMSVVGPRPEAPDLAELYPPEAKVLFSVKPGLVGPNQILNRNEEELYPEGVDVKDYYIRKILPKKLDIDLEYVAHPTFLNELKYILLAIKETAFGAISRRHFFENRSQIYLFLFDMAFVVGSYFFAIGLRFEGKELSPNDFMMMVKVFPILLGFQIICFVGFGLYGALIRYLNLTNYVTVAKATTVSSLLSAVTVYLLGFHGFPRSIWIINWFSLNLFMVAIRVPGKIIRGRMYGKDDERKRVMIYGAGQKGGLAAGQLRTRFNILGFLDDDRTKKNKRFQEFTVLGNRFDIEPLSKIYPVDEIVIAISKPDQRNLDHIISLCNRASVKYSVFMTVVDYFSDRVCEEHMHRRKLFDWSGSADIKMDPASAGAAFSGREVVLIGASNLLGMEMVKDLCPLGPKRVTLIDRYEAYLNETFRRSLNLGGRDLVRPCLTHGPIPDELGKTLAAVSAPSVVVHLATRKYPSDQDPDPIFAVKENILNTWDLLQTARERNCELFVMASGTSALVPASVMEATLALAERLVLHTRPSAGGMRSTVVRLFNLVENRGSIIRLIESQLRDGRKVLLSHPDDECYFITAASASKLILLSGAMAVQGEQDPGRVYMPYYNGAAKVLDLARLIIQDFGLDPERDVEIGFLCDDPGKARKERIELNGASVMKTEHKGILKCVPETCMPEAKAVETVKALREMVEREDRDGAEQMVWEAIGGGKARYQRSDVGCQEEG